MKGIVFIIPLAVLRCCSASITPNSADPDELMDKTSEVVRDALDASGAQGYSLTIITDGTATSASVYRFTGILTSRSGTAIFEVEAGSDIVQLAPSLRKLHVSSKYPHVIVASDKRDFLLSVVEALYSERVLVWATKLLLITRLPISDVQALRVVLANVNGMVLICETKGKSKKCKIDLYVPYSFRLLEVAKWTSNNGISYTGVYRMFPEKFSRLIDGAHLTVTAEIYPPLIMPRKNLKSSSRDPTVILSGPLIEVLKIISKSVNFTCTWNRPTDVAFGYQFPNGSWGGMVGMVARKEVDFSFLIFTVLYTRSQVVDYSIPLTFTYCRFLGRKGETEIDPFGFLAPLTTMVWIYLLLSMLVVMAISEILSYFLIKSHGESSVYSIMNYVRIFLGQDPGTFSIDDKSRLILVSMWLMMTSIVTKSYSGNLNSLLAVRYVPQPYHTIKAVAQDRKVQVITEVGGYYHQSIRSGFFKELTDAHEKGRISYVEFTEFEDIVDNLISKGGYVLMNDDLPSKMLIDHNFSITGKCLFYMSKEYFFPQISAMIAPKYSPLIPVLNQRLVMIIESGLYEHWLRKEYVNSSSCEKAPSKLLLETSLSIYNIWGIFALTAGGYILSLASFVVEVMVPLISKMLK